MDEDSVQSPVFEQRLEALTQLGISQVAVLTVGGAITFAAGHAVGTGALSGLSTELGETLGKLALKQATKLPQLFTWQAATPFVVKVGVGVAGLATLGGGAAVVKELTETNPVFALEGDWDVGTFALDHEGFRESFLPSSRRARSRFATSIRTAPATSAQSSSPPAPTSYSMQ